MVVLTAPQFESFVSENENRLAMIHFRADWNPLDQEMCGLVEDVESAVSEQVAVASVDVSLPVNAELVNHLGLTHLPALLFVFRHRVVDYRVGFSRTRFINHVVQLTQAFHPYQAQMSGPWHPGPFPSGIVLAAVAPPGESRTGQGDSVDPPQSAEEMAEPQAAAASPGTIVGGSWIASQRPDQFGLIPFQLVPQQAKRSWWERILGR